VAARVRVIGAGRSARVGHGALAVRVRDSIGGGDVGHRRKKSVVKLNLSVTHETDELNLGSWICT
jgi:hypothetical protein